MGRSVQIIRGSREGWIKQRTKRNVVHIDRGGKGEGRILTESQDLKGWAEVL
jgi:hypothetical protein